MLNLGKRFDHVLPFWVLSIKTPNPWLWHSSILSLSLFNIGNRFGNLLPFHLLRLWHFSLFSLSLFNLGNRFDHVVPFSVLLTPILHFLHHFSPLSHLFSVHVCLQQKHWWMRLQPDHQTISKQWQKLVSWSHIGSHWLQTCCRAVMLHLICVRCDLGVSFINYEHVLELFVAFDQSKKILMNFSLSTRNRRIDQHAGARARACL